MIPIVMMMDQIVSRPVEMERDVGRRRVVGCSATKSLENKEMRRKEGINEAVWSEANVVIAARLEDWYLGRRDIKVENRRWLGVEGRC